MATEICSSVQFYVPYINGLRLFPHYCSVGEVGQVMTTLWYTETIQYLPTLRGPYIANFGDDVNLPCQEIVTTHEKVKLCYTHWQHQLD